jgi:hypothetical protein
MEVMGFIFGLVGFVVASSAMNKLRNIETQLRRKGLLTDPSDPSN